MNILEKLQERVAKKEAEGTVVTKEQLQLFASGYLQGIKDQRNEGYFSMTDTDKQVINEWIENHYKKNFYFTFGSWAGFPYQYGYIIVRAADIKEAAIKFKEKYPNRLDETVLNCSDYYDEEDWQQILDHGFYEDQEPYEVME